MFELNPTYWTPAERLAVTGAIAARHQNLTAGPIAWHRLQALANETSDYLERRRAYILQSEVESRGGTPIQLFEKWSIASEYQFGRYGSREALRRKSDFVPSAHNYRCKLRGAEPYSDEPCEWEIWGDQLSIDGRVLTLRREQWSYSVFLGEVDPLYRQWLRDECGIELDDENPLKPPATTGKSVADDLLREFVRRGMDVPPTLNREARLYVSKSELDIAFERNSEGISLILEGCGAGGAQVHHSHNIDPFDKLSTEECGKLVSQWIDSYLSTAGRSHPPGA